MRESGVNQRCDPSERILLPRLMDAVHDALDLMRAGKTPILAAVDIADAFHNVPAGRDKKYTMANLKTVSGTSFSTTSWCSVPEAPPRFGVGSQRSWVGPSQP